jgi:hypothetical protein
VQTDFFFFFDPTWGTTDDGLFRLNSGSDKSESANCKSFAVSCVSELLDVRGRSVLHLDRPVCVLVLMPAINGDMGISLFLWSLIGEAQDDWIAIPAGSNVTSVYSA